MTKQNKKQASKAAARAGVVLEARRRRRKRRAAGHERLRSLDGAADAVNEAVVPASAAAGGRAGPDGRAAAAAVSEHWKEEPDEHDYPAARDYLSLLLADSGAEHAVAALERAPLVRRKAKDLLRASRLVLLPADDPAVARDLGKARSGAKLSPVLALRGRLGTDVPLTVADGYHRICASYHLDEDAEIPCKLADIARR